MRPSLRTALADSHVAAVAVATLFLASLLHLLENVGYVAPRAMEYVATAVAIHGIPASSSPWPSGYDLLMLVREASVLFVACFGFATAWLLSHWVYRAGPFQSLAKELTAVLGRSDGRPI